MANLLTGSVKRLLFAVFLVSTFTFMQAQSPDEKIGNCLNNSDFFSLDEQYSILKDSIQNPMLKVFSEALLNAAFNKPEQACSSIDLLLNSHQDEIGFGNVQAMFLWKCRLLDSEGRYNEAVENLNYFMETVSAYMDSSYLNLYRDLYYMCDAKKNIPKSELLRAKEDCSVPVEIDSLKVGGSHMFIPVVLNGVEERFIFDTGCPGGAFISERFAKKHNVKIIIDSIMVSGTGTGVGKIGFIDSVRIGNMIYKNLSVIIVPPNPMVDTVYQVDAVLGSGIMKLAGEVQIFPKEKRIVFPIVETPVPVTGRNMMFQHDQPFLKTYSGKERLIMHFDTGNAASDLHSSYYEKNRDKIEQIGYKDSKISGGFGKVEMTDIYRLPVFPLQVGSRNFEMNNLIVNINPIFVHQGDEDGALGMSFVLLFDKVTFNFNQMFLEVE